MTQSTVNPIINDSIVDPQGNAQAAERVFSEPTITDDIRVRINQIVGEQNQIFMERGEVTEGIWVARIAQQHVLMVGPGGTGKTMLARDTAGRIDGSVYFETTLDENSDPAQVFGPPDVAAMVGDPANGVKGEMRWQIDGMLPEATDAMIDEIFNGNGPTLHATMPVLNERTFANGKTLLHTPLRQCIAGSNKINDDPDLAAMRDRLHHRFVVGYVRSRTSLITMAAHNVARMARNAAQQGTRTTAGVGQTRTSVTLDELDRARAESLSLYIPDPVFEAMIDMKDELMNGEASVEISDRRWNDGILAVLANAWLRGHHQVTVGDLDVLANMWWTMLDQVTSARKLILSSTNPSQKRALELMEDLDKAHEDYRELKQDDDETTKRKVAIAVIAIAENVVSDANAELEKAKEAGTNTSSLVDAMEKAHQFIVKVSHEVFGIAPGSVVNQARP